MTAEMSSSTSVVDQAVCMDSATLQEQIQRLVSLRVPGCGVNALCGESLDKRRRKWRKRHKSNVISVPKGNNDSSKEEVRAEIESLLSSVWEVQSELATARKEGLDAVSQLRAEKWEHCLLAINYRLCHSKLSLEGLQQTQPPHIPPDVAPSDLNHHQIIQDLQTALTKARSLKTVKVMKLTETPRVPTITTRSSPTKPLTPLPLLSQEPPSSLELDIVSLPQTMENTLDCNNNISTMVTTEVSTTLPVESPAPIISMPVSFMPANPSLTPMGEFTHTSDTDTSPTVGMEVVCGAGEFTIDNDVLVASSHSIALPDRLATPVPLIPAETTNTETPLAKKPRTTPSSTKTKRRSKKCTTPRQRHSKRLSRSPHPSAVENGVKTERLSDTDTDTDSELRKMLEVLERAPYYLRVPQKNLGENTRYSFQNGVSVTEDVKKKRRSVSSDL